MGKTWPSEVAAIVGFILRFQDNNMNNTVHVKYISLLLGLVGFNHYHFFLMANYFRPDQAQQSCWASSGLNWFRILSLAHFTRSGPAISLGLAGLELTPELSQ